ncbi:MAG: sodium-dependent transporter [Selenomonadales bacterium]|nr:sodium-dependent transporter [Selenomonadales bacterium]
MSDKTPTTQPGRELWSGKLAFILASAGSAIGLGNIWMFPWRMGTYGGSAFLLIYVLIVALIGVVALMGEFALGRVYGKGPISAVKEAFASRKLAGGQWVGLLPVLATGAVTVFYMIVVGWVFNYVGFALRGFAGHNLAAAFNSFAGSSGSVPWHILAIVLTTAIVYFGVKKGLEPANNILLPALFGILVVLAVRALTLPGADEGLRFIFTPDFSHLGNPLTWFNALAQALFSLSLLGCTLVIYGSYLPKETDIPQAALYTAVFDTGAAILAALIVFPTAFAFGVAPNSGIPLLFVTLPGLFAQMPAGALFGTLFFLLVAFAAITSAVSLFESAVEPMMDAFKWDRKKSTLATGALSLLMGLPLALNQAWFTSWMRFTSAIVMPVGTLIMMIVIFWVYGSSLIRKEVNHGAATPMPLWWDFLGKYVAVFGTLFILVGGALRYFGLWK